jgi:hypothetical protein
MVLHGMTMLTFLFVRLERTWLFISLKRIFFFLRTKGMIKLIKPCFLVSTANVQGPRGSVVINRKVTGSIPYEVIGFFN